MWEYHVTMAAQGQNNIRLSFCPYHTQFVSPWKHSNDIIMGAMASQITSLSIVYSTVYSRRTSKEHQSSASLAVVRGIHSWPVNSPHKGPVTRKVFPFDDVIIEWSDNFPNKTSMWLLVAFSCYEFIPLVWHHTIKTIKIFIYTSSLHVVIMAYGHDQYCRVMTVHSFLIWICFWTSSQEADGSRLLDLYVAST